MQDLDGCFSAALQLVRENRPAAVHTQPLVSVVVCAYRHAAYIEECLASIDATSPALSIELIIIDDGSPDDTLARCVTFNFRPDLPLRIYTKTNHGLVHSLRCALELSRGSYLALMASDDMYVSGGLERVEEILSAAEPRIDALLCQAQYILEDGREASLVYGPTQEKFFAGSAERRLEAVCVEFPKPLLLQASVLDIKLLLRVGAWGDGFMLDDWPTFIRIFTAEAEGSAIVRYEPDILLCKYRQHSSGLHNQLEPMLRFTESIAREMVPARFSETCLANVRIDIGLSHVYQGNHARGLWLCILGLLTSPTVRVAGRLWRRVAGAISRRIALLG